MLKSVSLEIVEKEEGKMESEEVQEWTIIDEFTLDFHNLKALRRLDSELFSKSATSILKYMLKSIKSLKSNFSVRINPETKDYSFRVRF